MAAQLLKTVNWGVESWWPSDPGAFFGWTLDLKETGTVLLHRVQGVMCIAPSFASTASELCNRIALVVLSYPEALVSPVQAVATANQPMAGNNSPSNNLASYILKQSGWGVTHLPIDLSFDHYGHGIKLPSGRLQWWVSTLTARYNPGGSVWSNLTADAPDVEIQATFQYAVVP